MDKNHIGQCAISAKINLDEKWSREDVTTGRIIDILIRHDSQFEQTRDGSSISEVILLNLLTNHIDLVFRILFVRRKSVRF